MRNLVSFLDASVLKRVLLLGDFEIYGEDDSTTEFLQNYKEKIRENYFGRGWIGFLHQHADSAFPLVPSLGSLAIAFSFGIIAGVIATAGKNFKKSRLIIIYRFHCFFFHCFAANII